MVFGRVVIDCLIAFARIDVNNNFHQGGQFMEQTVTHFLSEEMALQGGQLTIHSNVHFTI